MANEIPDSTDVTLHIFCQRQRVRHQSSDPLSQHIIEPLDVVGFAGVFGEGLVLTGIVQVIRVDGQKRAL